MKNDFILSKEHSFYVKGIAIFLMFAHHLFGFGEWILAKNNYMLLFSTHQFFSIICFYFGGISIGLFSFISGYSMYINSGKYKKYNGCIHKLIGFLLCYWIVELLFLFLGVISKEPLPSLPMFIKQSFGVSVGHNGTINIIFAWYVLFYIIFILIHPIIIRLSKFSFVIDALIYGVLFYSMYIIVKQPCWSISADTVDFCWKTANYGYIGMIGYLCAKYNIFEKIEQCIEKISCRSRWMKLGIAFFVIVGILCIKIKLNNFSIFDIVSNDVLFIPFIIYAFIIIYNNLSLRFLKRIVMKCGENSMNMWYLHAIFFTPNFTFQFIAYCFRYPILILIWTVFIAYICSIPIYILQNKILKKYNEVVNDRRIEFK